MKRLLAFILLSVPAVADTGWEGAIRVENGVTVNTYQLTIATQTSPTRIVTTVISPSVQRACVRFANTSPNYRVFIGSHTGVTIANGFPINVSTNPLSNMIAFDQVKGKIYAQAEGVGTGPNPILAVLECKDREGGQ